MKKIILFLSIGFSALVLASCGGIDSDINAFEKACESGDLQKIAKASEQIDKHKPEDFTPEQTKRLAKATKKCAEKSAESLGF